MPTIKSYVVDPEKRTVQRYDFETGGPDVPWEDNIYSRAGRYLGLHDPVYEHADGELGELAVIHDYTRHGTPVSIHRLTVRGPCMIIGEGWGKGGDSYIYDVPITLDEARAMITFWRAV